MKSLVFVVSIFLLLQVHCKPFDGSFDEQNGEKPVTDKEIEDFYKEEDDDTDGADYDNIEDEVPIEEPLRVFPQDVAFDKNSINDFFTNVKDVANDYEDKYLSEEYAKDWTDDEQAEEEEDYKSFMTSMENKNVNDLIMETYNEEEESKKDTNNDEITNENKSNDNNEDISDEKKSIEEKQPIVEFDEKENMEEKKDTVEDDNKNYNVLLNSDEIKINIEDKDYDEEDNQGDFLTGKILNENPFMFEDNPNENDYDDIDDAYNNNNEKNLLDEMEYKMKAVEKDNEDFEDTKTDENVDSEDNWKDAKEYEDDEDDDESEEYIKGDNFFTEADEMNDNQDAITLEDIENQQKSEKNYNENNEEVEKDSNKENGSEENMDENKVEEGEDTKVSPKEELESLEQRLNMLRDALDKQEGRIMHIEERMVAKKKK